MGGVLTIGNFDGVHAGHQQILQIARRLADDQGQAVVAMTFEPPPDLVLRPDDAPQRLLPPGEKCRLLLAAGADWVVEARTDRTILGMEADAFIAEVIERRFLPKHIVEGEDFCFGRRRLGNVQYLFAAGERLGFAAHVVPAITLEVAGASQRISSTLIRRLVAEGNVADAARCLGRPFTLFGNIVAGEGRGRLLEFPTANLAPGDQVLPGDGVYAGRATIAGKEYVAAVSVGTKPTLGPSPRVVEAFLIDARGDFYNQYLSLAFLRRVRGQQKFETMDALQAQIARDVQQVREICGQ